MATPTNQDLLAVSTDFSNKVGPDTEVWTVTVKYLVPKGTNMEQLLADIISGKVTPMTWATLTPPHVVDVTKL